MDVKDILFLMPTSMQQKYVTPSLQYLLTNLQIHQENGTGTCLQIKTLKFKMSLSQMIGSDSTIVVRPNPDAIFTVDTVCVGFNTQFTDSSTVITSKL